MDEPGQARQFPAKIGVVFGDDVVDELAEGELGRRLVTAPGWRGGDLRQPGQHVIEVQPFVRAGLPQRFVTAATVVDPQLFEEP